LAPSYLNESETISALRFGSTAKLIKNRPRINKEYTVEELLDMLEKA
jgi:kinesin family protein 5